MQLTLLDGPAASARYLRRYTCEGCGAVNCGGTAGPRMPVGEPGAYTCASGCWWCRSCSARLWEEHLGAVRVRERIERWLQGELWDPPGLPYGDWLRVMARLRAREAA